MLTTEEHSNNEKAALLKKQISCRDDLWFYRPQRKRHSWLIINPSKDSSFLISNNVNNSLGFEVCKFNNVVSIHYWFPLIFSHFNLYWLINVILRHPNDKLKGGKNDKPWVGPLLGRALIWESRDLGSSICSATTIHQTRKVTPALQASASSYIKRHNNLCHNSLNCCD